MDLPEFVEKVFTIDELCSIVFDGIESYYSYVEWPTSRAIISTKKPNLKDINEIMGSRIPGS